jgi:chorismate mutase
MATLEQLREKIAKIDHAIIKKLAARQKISDKIGLLKAKIGKPVIDPAREKKLQQFYKSLSERYQLDTAWVKSLFKSIFAYSRKCQRRSLSKRKLTKNGK